MAPRRGPAARLLRLLAGWRGRRGSRGEAGARGTGCGRAARRHAWSVGGARRRDEEATARAAARGGWSARCLEHALGSGPVVWSQMHKDVGPRQPV